MWGFCKKKKKTDKKDFNSFPPFSDAWKGEVVGGRKKKEVVLFTSMNM